MWRHEGLLFPVLVVGVLLVSLISADSLNYVRVNTDMGIVQGFRKSVLNRDVYHFLGIPFAEPPVGPLRFRYPEAKKPWSGVWDATKYPFTCFQSIPEPRDSMNAMSRMWLNNTEMSEDCLYLNVWTATLPGESSHSSGKKGRAVMVWIYGGGFTSGTSTLEVYNGAILAAKMNVIVVSMQYRVGPFGFLYLKGSDIPGNQGLMDQVQALKWIQNNIHHFGGDKARVTLFGESAGAVSISLHLLSPVARPYFHQAIMESASAIAWWATEGVATARKKAEQLAQLSGCRVGERNPEREKLLAECLRSLDAMTLIVNQWEISFAEPTSNRLTKLKNYFQSKAGQNFVPTAGLYFVVPFRPVVTPPYLDGKPKDILLRSSDRQQPLPRIMLGTNKDEGIYHLIEGMRHFFHKDREGGVMMPTEFRQSASVLDPIDILALYIMDEELIHSLIMQATAFHYQLPSRAFDVKDWTAKELIDALDDLTGDYNFKCPVINFANMYANQPNKPQVFVYSFEHRTRGQTWPLWTGVMHGYEIEYIFGMPFNDKFQREFYAFTEDEKRLSEQMMRFWTNFAATGSPNNHPAEFNSKSNFWESYEVPPAWLDNTYNPAKTARLFAENDEPEDNSGSRTEPITEEEYRKFRRHLVLGLNLTMGRNLRRKECLFWEKFLPDLEFRILAGEPSPDTVNCKNAV